MRSFQPIQIMEAMHAWAKGYQNVKICSFQPIYIMEAMHAWEKGSKFYEIMEIRQFSQDIP